MIEKALNQTAGNSAKFIDSKKAITKTAMNYHMQKALNITNDVINSITGANKQSLNKIAELQTQSIIEQKNRVLAQTISD